MLRELSVHNLALIEDLRVELREGFGAWTGETGAGKSLLFGRTHQVICVTDLPQVAANARHQWRIREATRGKWTATTFVALESDEQRMEEIASVMRGEARSATKPREAAAMLKTAMKKWQMSEIRE
jgi:DNA repair protein RecN (Recombination protein N)